MQKGLVDINLLIDRSGSMGAIREEAETGINFFITEQKKESGEANLTLVQFDSFNGISNCEYIQDTTPIYLVEKYNLVPRGMTPLFDAIGKTLNLKIQKIENTPETQRPEKILFVIMTDGQENISKEFTKEMVKILIKECEKDGWAFTYLGANQDSFAEAGGMGFSANATADYSMRTVNLAYQTVSNKVSDIRKGSAAGFTYTDDERNKLKSK